MSNSSVIAAIVSAMEETNRQLGEGAVWDPKDGMQKLFLLEDMNGWRPWIKEIPEMVASSQIEVIGDIKHIRAKSHLDVTVHWPEEGIEVKIIDPEDKDKIYPGVRLKREFMTFYSFKGHEYPVARINTQTNDEVWITMCPDGGNLVGRELDVFIRERFLLGEHQMTFHKFGGLKFPMIKFEVEGKIFWLIGMRGTDGDGFPAEIADASQMTKFGMNTKGARVISTVRIHTTVMMAAAPEYVPPDHVINRPFLLWITRPGIPSPYAIFWFDQENWKNPGDLSGL